MANVTYNVHLVRYRLPIYGSKFRKNQKILAKSKEILEISENFSPFSVFGPLFGGSGVKVGGFLSGPLV